MPALIFVNRQPFEVENLVSAQDLRALIEAPEYWPVRYKGMPGQEDMKLREGDKYYMDAMAEFLCHPEECD